MNFDWFVEFDTIQIADDIDKLVNGTDGFVNIKNIYSKTKLLANCLNKNEAIKNYAKSGKRINRPAGHKRIIIHKKEYNKLIREEIQRLKSIELYSPSAKISTLPPYSFFLQFTFTLASPYLSKDDEEFYICENPVRKDKVFKVPMVAATTWKGNLRWTSGKLVELKVADPEEKLLKRIQLSKLFGHENEAERRYFDSLMSDDKRTAFEEEMKSWSTNGLRSGRLNFYPTFFDHIGLEVINPHDRKTKAGTQPIYIESVPDGATGTFSLLYVPFDLMGKPQNQIRDEVIADLDMVCKALREMMLTYGFSAKKGSGFGVIKEKIDGTFEMSGSTIYKDNKYSSFNQLEQLIERLIKEVMKNDK